VATPDCGICRSLSAETPLYADDLWHVRHIEPPWGTAGWMLMISQRHVGGPAHFDDREARDFGPALRHFERVLERITGALRIYTAAMGESWPHFHCHMVPRYAEMPKGAKAWGVFDLQRAAREGEVTVSPDEVARISAAYAEALRREPVPRG
jgi:diadenosine tetraphosphate (Ap4A) HIT family hydrolase